MTPFQPLTHDSDYLFFDSLNQCVVIALNECEAFEISSAFVKSRTVTFLDGKKLVLCVLYSLVIEGILCFVLVLLFNTLCPSFAIILMGMRELVALL